MACAGCQKRREAIGRVAAAIRTGDKPLDAIRRETATVARSALSDLMRIARRREAK